MAITLQNLNVVIGADDSQLRSKMNALQRSVQQLGDRLSDVGRKMTIGLTVPLTALGAISVRAAAQMDSLTRGLEAVTGSAGAAQEQLSRLRDIAKLPAVDLVQATRASIAFQAIGENAQFAERTIKAVANAVALSGGGAEEFESVLRQLRQVRSLGKLMGEELNIILESAPALAKALETAFGTTSAERIREMGLTMEEFFTRFLGGAESLVTVSGGAANSLDNLRQATGQAAAEIGKQLLPVVLPMVEGLSKWLENLRTLNPEILRAGIAIGGVVAVGGPLLLLVGNLTSALSLMAIALQAQLVPLLLAAGPIVIGLGLIAAGFATIKLEALAAKGAVDAYTASLGGLSREAAEATKEDIQRARRALETERANIPPLSELADDPARLVQATHRIKEIDAAMAELGRQYNVVSARADELRTASVKPLSDSVVSATGAVEDLNDVLAENARLAQRFNRLPGGAGAPVGPQGGTLQDVSFGGFRGPLPVADMEVNAKSITLKDTVDRITSRTQQLGRSVRGFAENAGGGALDALGSSAMKLVNAFNPLGILATVFSAALESLAPALEPLINIVGRVGGILGQALLPILEALWPVIKLTVIAATYLGQIFFNVAGGIAFAVGNVIKAIGWLIDKINIFGGDGGIGKLGQGMIDMGKGFIEGAGALGKARDEIKKLDWESATAPLNNAAREAAYNVSEAFDAQRRRLQVSGQLAGTLANPDRRPVPHVETHDTYHITIETRDGEDVGGFVDRLGEELYRRKGLGGTSYFDLAFSGPL